MTTIDVTDQTFQAEVVDRSAEVTVVVDLWAEWCGPCKTLGPILEKVIAGTNGQVLLAKVDVDASPAVAQAFQVQSIPAVYAMRDGKVVDGFVGAQPEMQVEAWVRTLLPSDAEVEIQALIDAGDEASLRSALELDPTNDAAITALAGVLATGDDKAEALQLLAKIPETDETRRIAAIARVANAEVPDDVEAQLDELLTRIKDDEDAKQQYLDLLELMGSADDRTAEYRRRLSTALF